jgi:hypothetical protein
MYFHLLLLTVILLNQDFTESPLPSFLSFTASDAETPSQSPTFAAPNKARFPNTVWDKEFGIIRLKYFIVLVHLIINHFLYLYLDPDFEHLLKVRVLLRNEEKE